MDEILPPLQLRSVDLNGVAALAMHRLRRRFARKRISARFEALQPATPLVVSADPVRITQVLAELIGNAWTFTPVGGRVAVMTVPLESDAVVIVADTGIGFASGDVHRIFAPRPTGPGVSPGPVGAGSLAEAREVVIAHGGELTASSRGPGQGASFTLRLPLAR